MRRRDLVRWIGAAPLLAAAGASRADHKVRITGLEVLFFPEANLRGGWLVTRVRTSAGRTGLGDASHSYKDAVTASAIRRLFSSMEGRTVFEVERLRQLARPEIARLGRPAVIALSALEQCMWDLQGQLLGVPTYELFGGNLNARLRNYANVNKASADRTPDSFARLAEIAIGDGLRAVKLAPFDEIQIRMEPAAIDRLMDHGVACTAAVREAIGRDSMLLIDVHSRLDLTRGLDLARRLRPYDLGWLEEVTPAKPIDAMAAINRAAPMPTAGGENLHGVQEFLPYVSGRAVDIVMPDVKYCGGMLELKEIAAVAHGAGLQVAPHGPASPIGNVAAGHVCATMPNFHCLEYSHGDVPWRATLVEPREELSRGDLVLSDRPGFGIALNEKTVKRYARAVPA